MSPTTVGSLFTILVFIAAAIFTTAVLDKQDMQRQEEVTPFRKYRKAIESKTPETVASIIMIAALILLFLL